jgi:phosphatidylserine/phosphatidylglycerophosphate/cardiolipin synthase-like enzyme
LIAARRRGCVVRVITNVVDVINILNQERIFAKKLLIPNIVHAKMMIIDGEIAVVGSHNYTQSAFTMNYEVSLLVYDSDVCKNLLEFFNNLFWP